MSDIGCLLEEGWYLLKTRVREELRAQENLENQGFQSYCPVFKSKNKGQIKEEVLFPGYLFLQLELKRDLDKFHKIRSTRGVSEMVYFNRITREMHNRGRISKEEEERARAGELLPRPIPNGEDIITEIKAIVDYLNKKAEDTTNKVPAREAFQPGDKVFMSHPLYKGLEMTFEKDMGKYRGHILIQHIKEQRLQDGSIERNIIKTVRTTVEKKDLERVE